MKIYEILFSPLAMTLNAAEFRKKQREVLDAAFGKVFDDHAKKVLDWRRAGSGLYGQDFVTANTSVKNAAGEEVEVEVLLFSKIQDEGNKVFYLTLGEENGPTRGYYDPRVEKLVQEVFGEK